MNGPQTRCSKGNGVRKEMGSEAIFPESDVSEFRRTKEMGSESIFPESEVSEFRRTENRLRPHSDIPKIDSDPISFFSFSFRRREPRSSALTAFAARHCSRFGRLNSGLLGRPRH